MKKNSFYQLIQNFSVYDGGQISTWDIGERFIFRKAEPKRHGDGTYPDRLISLTDGSMIALAVANKFQAESKSELFQEADAN